MKTKENKEVVEFGTIKYLRDTWKDLFSRRKGNEDSLTRLRMREIAEKIQNKKARE